MAVRQYIGARYTIKIYENSLDPTSAEWESGFAYEYLTLVTVNNDVYLSRKDVPSSIGTPSANGAYWVQMGNFNGQISNLQNQINTINSNIDDIINCIAFNEDGNDVSNPNGYAAGEHFYRNGALYVAINPIAYNDPWSNYTLDTDYRLSANLEAQIEDKVPNGVYYQYAGSGSVTVTSDGVKTFEQLLNDLSAAYFALPNDGHTYLKPVKLDVGGYAHNIPIQCDLMTGGYNNLYFKSVTIAGTKTVVFVASVLSSGSMLQFSEIDNGTYNVTTVNSSVPNSGIAYVLHYLRYIR